MMEVFIQVLQAQAGNVHGAPGREGGVAVLAQYVAVDVLRVYAVLVGQDAAEPEGLQQGAGAQDLFPRIVEFSGYAVGSHIQRVRDHAQGDMQTTGNPLDLAISGQGYFAVQTPQGVRYTRDGNFYRAANGQLSTVNGQAVLDDTNQPITIPEETTSISVGTKGEVYADNQQIGQLQFVQFAGPQAVLKQGNNLYYAQNNAQPQAASGEIQQGMLERSNVNTVNEMVNLIANYRVYEANSKAVTTQDSMRIWKSCNQKGSSYADQWNRHEWI